MQRVAAGGREQHRVHAQGGGGTEQRPHVSGVHNALQHGHPPGGGENTLRRNRRGPAEGAKNPPGQLVAGEGFQHLPRGGVDRRFGKPGHQRRVGKGLLFFQQHGNGGAARLQRRLDHVGAFRHEKRVFRALPAAHLPGGKLKIGGQFRGGKVCDFDEIRHGVDPALSLNFASYLS